MFYDHREDIADACSVDGVQGANVQGVQGVDVQSSNVQGADVDNDQDAMRLALASPWTPAIGAAREGHTHIIDWLIDQGLMHPTDIHLFANHALCESLRFRHANAAFQLIELGADIHACQGTVVVDAARLGSMLLMESVLARGEVDVNVDGGRVLMEVVRQGDLQMLALLERSSNLNLYAHGPRALEAAVTAGNAEMVQALLDYGAAGRDVRMVVEKAIVVARKHGHAEIVRLLTAELKQQSSSSSTEDSRGVSATSDDDDDEWF